MRRRIVLVGATGTFGSRLAALLSGHDGIELLLAARSAGALETLRADLMARGAPAQLGVHVLDRTDPRALSG